jgi:WD40 repeat protein
MCGRHAQYESTVTGDGVCSLECKVAQVLKPSVQGESSGGGGGVELRPPLPVKRPGANIPVSAGCEFAFFHRGSVTAVAISSQSSRAYSVGDGAVKAWDVTRERQHQHKSAQSRPVGTAQVEGGGSLTCCVVSDDDMVVAGGTCGMLKVFDLTADAAPHQGGVDCVTDLSSPSLWPAWAPDKSDQRRGGAIGGSPLPVVPTKLDVGYSALAMLDSSSPLCFAGCAHGEIFALDLALKEHVRVFAGGHVAAVTAVRVASKGHTMVSGGLDRRVVVWDLFNLTSRRIDFPAAVTALDVCPMYKLAMIGLGDGTIWSLDLADMSYSLFSAAHDSVCSITFAPTGDWFASTGRDKAGENLVCLWELSSVVPVLRITEAEAASGPHPAVVSSAISADGSMLITGSETGFARVYRVKMA